MATIGALLIIPALLLFPVTRASAIVPPFTFDSYYGDGAQVTYAGNPAVELSSATCTDCQYGVTYGGAIFDAPSGFTIGNLSTLSATYFMNTGDCSNGAPRFSLWLDPTGGTEVWVYLGPTGYGGPGCTTSPWQATGNLAGSPAIGQSAASVFPNTSGCGGGNVAYTWSAAVACLGPSTPVYAISLDVDGGTATNSQDALFQCGSITINSFVFLPCSTTRGVPEFPSGALALLAIAIPAIVLLKARYSPKVTP